MSQNALRFATRNVRDVQRHVQGAKNRSYPLATRGEDAPHDASNPGLDDPFRDLEGPIYESDRDRLCTQKQRLADERAVRTYLNRFARSRGNHGRPKRLSAYRCPFCAGFHLTKAKA